MNLGLALQRCCLWAMVASVGTSTALASAAEVTHKVRMYHDFGTIDIDLYGEDSPRHVANFLRYVDADLFDFTYSHRTRSGSLRFIQGGSFYLPSPLSLAGLDDNPVPVFQQIKHEAASSDLSNTAGTLAAARGGHPDSASSGWFFNVTNNAAGFDYVSPQNPGYTVFGEVSSGWEDFSTLPYFPVVSDLFSSGVPAAVTTAPLINVGTTENPAYRPPIFYEWVRVPLTPGDFNLDGLVNLADEAVWQAAQGTNDNLTADADGDGDVDQADRGIWQANLGSGELMDLLGDFNGNGVVNEADYLWWTTTFGSTITLDADGSGNGVIDAADYSMWRDHLTTSAGSLVATNVPEPSTAMMAGALLACIAAARARRLKHGATG